MSARDSVTSAPEKKRTRSRKNPTPDNERAKAYQARKRETHREIKVFISVEAKQALIELCESEGVSQASMLEQLIQEKALQKNKL